MTSRRRKSSRDNEGRIEETEKVAVLIRRVAVHRSTEPLACNVNLN